MVHPKFNHRTMIAYVYVYSASVSLSDSYASGIGNLSHTSEDAGKDA